jgi:hypothetical protein
MDMTGAQSTAAVATVAAAMDVVATAAAAVAVVIDLVNRSSIGH